MAATQTDPSIQINLATHMGSQRVGYNLATEQQKLKLYINYVFAVQKLYLKIIKIRGPRGST